MEPLSQLGGQRICFKRLSTGPLEFDEPVIWFELPRMGVAPALGHGSLVSRLNVLVNLVSYNLASQMNFLAPRDIQQAAVVVMGMAVSRTVVHKMTRLNSI